MQTSAVVFTEPEHLELSLLALTSPSEDDLLVEVEWSGISTGTERLLWSGRMPFFPGLGYPLVPGYESVGRVADAGARAILHRGQRVFVPGARCFGPVRSLFGATAARLVVPAHRVVAIDEEWGERGVLLALAATAHHALSLAGATRPDCIVGHGVLGRLLARLTMALGGTTPVVWERNPDRREGRFDYPVIDPSADARRDFTAIYDVSGDAALLDTLITRLASGGEIVLAGFYDTPLSFAFPPAFMREARIRVAAEWLPSDLRAVKDLIACGQLSLDGLISHRQQARQAAVAYRTAFEDPTCLKMILDWRSYS
jgi:bacteriochlorophyllide a dehydrogenase